jgi:hypothetical protein
MAMLRVKLDNGDITKAWYDQRMSTLERQFPDERSDRQLHTTSEFTFLGPLRFHLTRAARLRASELGREFGAHESDVDRELTGRLTPL